MRQSNIIQVISACILLCLVKTGAITVKYGTNDGPIVPPTPEPKIVPQPPFRIPAPVWEDLSDDIPNPNPYRPPLILKPFTRYTQVNFGNNQGRAHEPVKTVESSAQRFVNAYRQPTEVPTPATTNLPKAESSNYSQVSFVRSEPPNKYDEQNKEKQGGNKLDSYNQAKVLGVKYVPSYGLKYFVPAYDNGKYYKSQKNEKESKHNLLETNDIFADNNEHSNDLELKYDKYALRRNSRHIGYTNTVPVYRHAQWPLFVPSYNQHPAYL